MELAATTPPPPQPTDPEKATTTTTNATTHTTPSPTVTVITPPKHTQCLSLLARLTRFETHGIARVPPSERQAPSKINYAQIALLWFSANTTANNLAVGLMGPLVFGLGFTDAALCAVFGAVLGALSTAYMGVWGAPSGLRTVVLLRCFMGFYPSMVCCLLNIVLMVGYGTIDCIISGQIIAAVSDERLSIAVGVVVVSVVVGFIAVLGLPVFHLYERIAWLPQLLALFALIASAQPYLTTSSSTSTTHTTRPALPAARLSFLSLALYVPNSWAAASSDFAVRLPATTPRRHSFFLTLAGLLPAFTLVNVIGVALGATISSTSPPTTWAAANATSTGALLVTVLAPLGGFGRFCAVLLALGSVANAVPGTYSAGLGCEVLAARRARRVPRAVWAAGVAGAQAACALAGRESLFAVFGNLLPLMGYWVMVMVCVVGLEHAFFRGRGWGWGWHVWANWEDRASLPAGIAAGAAFAAGCAAAVVGMCQVWFVGPLARLVGPDGADVGVWVACAVVVVVYPPLRAWEMRRFGR
ncbi:uncharacterized protein K452DRAFT_236843 [Aplosporella prunicola CBS 121167]|uniref:Uncharacterized protein n=1 Tax=Aplosporella prunicola CBS 121167 TaxID=1176127 RepID=A0A6A6B055_9PEZI|nr:uncharacterized protein K452DRAFT_236843 [Aplosporella prunicola CBS 121167]KAF2136823.1 hypothetical protein K452DRAFT_236843 [Aplosporella prunicola CBS 121167]